MRVYPIWVNIQREFERLQISSLREKSPPGILPFSWSVWFDSEGQIWSPLFDFSVRYAAKSGTHARRFSALSSYIMRQIKKLDDEFMRNRLIHPSPVPKLHDRFGGGKPLLHAWWRTRTANWSNELCNLAGLKGSSVGLTLYNRWVVYRLVHFVKSTKIADGTFHVTSTSQRLSCNHDLPVPKTEVGERTLNPRNLVSQNSEGFGISSILVWCPTASTSKLHRLGYQLGLFVCWRPCCWDSYRKASSENS